MSHEFHIQEGRWSNRRLRTAFEAWLPRTPVPLLAAEPLGRGAGGPGMWLFGEGAIRGCSLSLTGSVFSSRGVRVRMNTLASRADWQIGHGLLRELLQTGGGKVVGPDGAPVAAELLREPEAGSEALAQLTADARDVEQELKGGRAFAALPNPAFTLLVTPGLLPDESDSGRFALALEDELVEMAARYQAAEAVPVITMPDANTLSVWNGGDALVYLSHYIALGGADEDDDGLVVRGQRLLGLLGERIEAVSEDQDRFFLPALDRGNPEDADILETLRKEGQPLSAWLARFPS